MVAAMSALIATPAKMLAYVGSPSGPQLRSMATPDPAPAEALVEVQAFSVNPGEPGLFPRPRDARPAARTRAAADGRRVDRPWTRLDEAMRALRDRRVAGRAILTVES
jgi:hypothetical protein